MKVLITGVAGVLGGNLASYLLRTEAYEIVGVDYSDTISLPDDIKYHKMDLRHQSNISPILCGVDTVVHCASASPSFDDKDIFSINVDATRLLLENSMSAGVTRFVYLSSTAVYGIPKTVPVDEEAELQPFHDAYNRSKVAAEEVCHEFRARGLTLSILRPRTFVGPGRLGTFAMLNDWASCGRGFPMLGSGTNRYQFLDVEDLCQAIELCMIKPKAVVNDTFNIGAERFSTMRDDYQAVLDRAGYGKRIVPLPAAPIIVALEILEKLRLSPLYRRLYKKLRMDYYVSIEKAKDKLGFQPRYSNAETLVRCYDWYVQNKNSISSQTGKSNSSPWEQGALKFGKHLF